MSFTSDQPPEIRYVLVYQGEHVAEFNTLQEAFKEGAERYGPPPFTVIEKRPEEEGFEEIRDQSREPLILIESEPFRLEPKRWWHRSGQDSPPPVWDYPPS